MLASSSSTEQEEQQKLSIQSNNSHRLWALAGAAQLGWGIFSFRREQRGECRMMPLKAFVIASLFVGSAASASMFGLRSSGIRNVEDVMVVGANFRTWLGVLPRIIPDRKTIIYDNVSTMLHCLVLRTSIVFFYSLCYAIVISSALDIFLGNLKLRSVDLVC